MEEKIVIIAKLESKKDLFNENHQVLKDLVIASREEKGCLCYNLHVNTESPYQFLMYEIWLNKEHLNQHLDAIHFKCFKSLAEINFEKIEIKEYTPVQIINQSKRK